MKKKYIYLTLIILVLLIALGFIICSKTKKKEDTDINKIEHVISIRTGNKKIDAVTGSFCYKNACIDKIDFQDFEYDTIPTYYGNKLYIENLDGTIKSVRLFDYSLREPANGINVDFTNDFTNDYIVTPSVSGIFIFIIDASYEGKSIEYYFLADISKISGEEVNVELKIKENTLTNTGLTMIVTNKSDKDLSYGNPFGIEKSDAIYFRTLRPINEMAFNLPAFSLKKNETVELPINWEYGYGKLKGKYRIVKSFHYEENGEIINFIKYLEFEI